MCVVVDVNVVPHFYCKESSKHGDFIPLLEWIKNRKGKVVYGGRTYQAELGCFKNSAWLDMFSEWKRSGRTHHEDDEKVDAMEASLKQVKAIAGFDDYHIIALVIISRSKIVCSENSSHYRYLRDRDFYKHCKVERPGIYTKKSCRSLLRAHFVGNHCGPCSN